MEGDLVEAAMSGDTRTVQRCLEAGVDINCKDEVGARTMHCTARILGVPAPDPHTWQLFSALGAPAPGPAHTLGVPAPGPCAGSLCWFPAHTLGVPAPGAPT
jgi:hypothetical protein